MVNLQKKILITGAAGFIGYHLVKKLCKEGYEVVGIDNLNSYYDIRLKAGRLDDCGIDSQEVSYNERVDSYTLGNYTFYQLDLSDKGNLRLLFQENQFDAVVNLAAQAGVRYSITHPDSYVESNVTGFLNILEACRNFPVKHLVFASSSSVYGANSKIPYSTEDKTDHPVSLYAASKKSNELMAHTYSHLFGVPITGLRFFTVYGPWGRPDMAYFLFTKAILRDQPIKVFNEGKMSRDFTYVDDIVEGIERVLVKPPSNNDGAPYKIYNIGNNAPVNLLTFVETIEQALGKTATKEFLPMQPGDVETTYADVSDLIRDFGYQPNTSLKEGIGKFVSWYRDYYRV